MKRNEAVRMRALIEQAAQSLPDREASEAPALFPHLKGDGKLIATGTRILWAGEIRRANVDMWDRPESNPDNAPSMWDRIRYKDGERIIPSVIPASLAFAEGEKGWWGDVLYISTIPANVWTPADNPDGWEALPPTP